jgi:hypothetical protein
MINGATGVVVVVIFALVAGYHLVRLTIEPTTAARILDVAHVVMAAVMILMPSGLSMRIPAVLQLTVFTAFALWFTYRALFAGNSDIEPDSHHTGLPRLLYHCLMMLAMAAMAVVMAPATASSAGTGSAGSHMSGMSHMSDMPGMSDMSGMSGMSGSPHGSPGSMVSGHAWAGPWMVAIGTGFAIAAVWYLGRFLISLRTSETRRAAGLFRTANDVLMALGMALTFLVVNA